MENKIKQAVLEMIRLGESVETVQRCLQLSFADLEKARYWEPVDNEFMDYVQAIKDADFRP